jgi:uncharacterized protein YndB with AHSA1/START domain
MPKIDVTDEGVIDAPPMAVYKAILNEYAGVTHWWLPFLEFKLKGDLPIDREGAIFEMKGNSKGMRPISAKMTKIVETKSIEYDMFAGDLVGTGTWTFEPVDGKTKVRYRLNCRTNRLLISLVSPFVNIAKGHSGNMQKGFKALNSYLQENKTK